MCGISGYFLCSSYIASSIDLDSSKNNLMHRGPDDSGLFENRDHGVGLAHARLSILDLSPLGHQPMLSDDGKLALVFNGEIYNFRELRTELEAAGRVFRGNSDTEVLLHLYLDCSARGGDLSEVLRKLNGIFTFALWDSGQGELLLARDAFGVKPLYYSADASRFAFASEIKALKPLVQMLGPLDKTSLHRYLTFLWCPGDGTPLKNVKKLGPGEFLRVRGGAIVEQAIWYRLPIFHFANTISDKSAAVNGCVEHLRAAVHRQLIADVPVGAFLSGGLDSSAVVALASEVHPELRCFTIDTSDPLEEKETEDLPYARRVAQHLHVPLEVVRVDHSRFATDLTDLVVSLEEPLADPAALNVLYISRIAREQGINVLLSGAGGDDLFAGYRRHLALTLEGVWNWLPNQFLHKISDITCAIPQDWAWGRRLKKVFKGSCLEGDARLVDYFMWCQRKDLWSLYTPEFRIAVGEAEAATPMLNFLAECPEQSSLERMLALEQRFFLADHNLTYTDKMSMAVGVEVRVPFLDLELVEFARRIPPHFKIRNGETKWVLKKGMEPYLPKDVIYRKKMGFGLPLRRWLCFELDGIMREVLSADNLKRRGLFDPIAVQNMISANKSGRIDASYTLFSLMIIEIWCRHFIDGHVS